MRREAPRSRRAGAVGVLFVFAVFALACSCNLAVGLSDLQGGCPPKRGAAQVKVTSASSPFCIDTTETTNAQYLQFFQSGFKLPATQTPDGCQALTYPPKPSNDWPPGPGYEDYPVTNVSWCQGYAFCAWAGKRMCGQIGRGALSPQNAGISSLSQWLNACTQGGARAYPYGNTFNQSVCGGGGGTGSRLELVKQRPGCVGGVPGVYDMSGNVWEWTDTCDSANGTTPASGVFCKVTGGAFDSQPPELACASLRNWTRSSDAGNIGIRCCLDL